MGASVCCVCGYLLCTNSRVCKHTDFMGLNDVLLTLTFTSLRSVVHFRELCPGLPVSSDFVLLLPCPAVVLCRLHRELHLRVLGLDSDSLSYTLLLHTRTSEIPCQEDRELDTDLLTELLGDQ